MTQIMLRHKDWRKIAKRERRRKIRVQGAKERDNEFNFMTNEHQDWLKEQETLELFEREHIEKLNEEENRKWLEAEKVALEQWQKILEKKEWIHQKHLEQQARLKLEWELEQKRKKEEEERLKEIEEQNRKKQELFINQLEQFLSGDSVEPPAELLISRETRPNTDICPFFSKTACCRFGDQCSRNHQYPGISKVLLATNFYIHFGLDNATHNEYDTDVLLEYEDSDTYKEFKEFFYDVLPEFEKFGKIVQFKVCNNHEKHLRGNTYVEFAKLRCAVAAYRSLHARWYGGRQLSLQFCHINSWKNAICGLQSRRRCPKGRACNFLHVFRNPDNLFSNYDVQQNSDSKRRTPPKSWRWSESPEKDVPNRRRSEYSERRRRDEKYEDSKRHSKDRRRSHSSRRRSSERNKKERSHNSKRKSPERIKEHRNSQDV